MRILLTVFLVNLVFLPKLIQAQDSTIIFSSNIQALASSGKTPFWLQANQYGIIPKNGSLISGQWGIYKIYNPGNPRFIQWSAGAQLITNAGKESSVFLTDFFSAIKAGAIELSIGQRKEFTGLADSTLSTGSIAISPNARPYPKIQISTPGFVNIIPFNDIFSFKFTYSDGLIGSSMINYGNVSTVPKTYMHQKSLYFRLGGVKHKISLYAGFNHQAMWGGEDKIFTGGLKLGESYRYVVLGKPWAGSRVGNHFGTIDLGLEWRCKNWNIFLYRQNIYEDGSLAKLTNIADGLNGLRFKRSRVESEDQSFKVNTFLVEFIYTKEQGGSIFDYDKGIFGSDNYFNHYIYNQGWSYKGRSLGTPLSGPQDMMKSDIPRSNLGFTSNNRISSLHMGLKATWNKNDLLLKATYSQNFGTYPTPFSSPRSQYSFLIRVERAIHFWNNSLLSISLATDQGKLYSNTSAISFGLRKLGFLR